MNKVILCDNCCRHFTDEEIDANEESFPCPSCGSNEKTIKITIIEQVTAHEALSGKVTNKNYPSKKNPRRKFFVGEEIRRDTGKWVNKERNIDQDNNIYKEVVTDPETGEIIHFCEEPLTDHTGHGSAKRR